MHYKQYRIMALVGELFGCLVVILFTAPIKYGDSWCDNCIYC